MTYLLMALAAWRLTALLVYDGIFQWLRDLVKVYVEDEKGNPKTLLGKILSCFWCTSVYMALFVFLVERYLGVVWLVPFAISGAAILLNHIARVYLAVQQQ